MPIQHLLMSSTRLMLAIGILSALLPNVCADAQPLRQARTVFIPVTFYAEDSKIRTSACLQAAEKELPADQWWKHAAHDADSMAEQAVVKVIAALAKGDKDGLAALTDVAPGEDFSQKEARLRALIDQTRQLA